MHLVLETWGKNLCSRFETHSYSSVSVIQSFWHGALQGGVHIVHVMSGSCFSEENAGQLMLCLDRLKLTKLERSTLRLGICMANSRGLTAQLWTPRCSGC